MIPGKGDFSHSGILVMMKTLKYSFFAVLATVGLYSCKPAGGNFGGSEYMPDMAHSLAYEYQSFGPSKYNTWDKESVVSRRFLSNPHLPVDGTIPRGYAGLYYAGVENYDSIMKVLRGGNALNAIAVPVNAKVPYYYANTEEERTRASADIVANPFPITESRLAKGKELYDIYCGICHGEKGDGAGYLVRDDGGKYPAAPANFMLDTFTVSTNGRFYHAIMYGKNVMGGYSEKLNFEERWSVIHYIRSLQAKMKNLAYSETANTYNPSFGAPAAQAGKKIALVPVAPAPAVAPAVQSGGGGGSKPTNK